MRVGPSIRIAIVPVCFLTLVLKSYSILRESAPTGFKLMINLFKLSSNADERNQRNVYINYYRCNQQIKSHYVVATYSNACCFGHERVADICYSAFMQRV